MSEHKLSEFENSILETINFLRLHPHMYTKTIEKSTILNTDEKVLLNNKLLKLENHYKPLKNIEILNLCAQSMLYYCILHDKGINELNINSIEMDEYFIKNRLRKFKINNPGKYHEFIVFNEGDSKEVINSLLIYDNIKLRLINPYYKYIGISCGILPSNRIACVIDIIENLNNKKIIKPDNMINYYPIGLNNNINELYSSKTVPISKYYYFDDEMRDLKKTYNKEPYSLNTYKTVVNYNNPFTLQNTPQSKYKNDVFNSPSNKIISYSDSKKKMPYSSSTVNVFRTPMKKIYEECFYTDEMGKKVKVMETTTIKYGDTVKVDFKDKFDV
jgi:hypothetical protein